MARFDHANSKPDVQTSAQTSRFVDPPTFARRAVFAIHQDFSTPDRTYASRTLGSICRSELQNSTPFARNTENTPFAAQTAKGDIIILVLPAI